MTSKLGEEPEVPYFGDTYQIVPCPLSYSFQMCPPSIVELNNSQARNAVIIEITDLNKR